MYVYLALVKRLSFLKKRRMYFLFIDESGSPEKSDNTLLFCLVGTAFKIEEYKRFTAFYNSLKYKFYPEIMTRPFTTNPKRDKEIKEQKELKAILKPDNIIDRRNQRFMKVTLKHCIKNCKISIHPVIFIKEKLDQSPSGLWIYPLAFKRLISSFNKFLLSENDNGILILDSRDPGSDDKLVASFFSYTSKDPFGVSCTNVVSPPLFARSLMTYGLQLAHHIAYIVYGAYLETYYSKKEGKDYALLREYWKMFIEGGALYGNTNQLRGIIVWE
jgi:hypothetical protein